MIYIYTLVEQINTTIVYTVNKIHVELYAHQEGWLP